MAFLVSPGVQVKETDLSNIIPAVSTSIGGFAGLFEWGPALEATQVSSEQDLIAKFGYPRISSNPGSSSRQDWYSAANFLSYAGNLQAVRILPEGARNAASEYVKTAGPTSTSIVVSVDSDYVAFDSDGEARGDYSFNIAYDGATTVTFTVPQQYVLNIDSEDAGVDLGYDYARLKGAFTQAELTKDSTLTINGDGTATTFESGVVLNNHTVVVTEEDNGEYKIIPSADYRIIDSDGSGTDATAGFLAIDFTTAPAAGVTLTAHIWESTDTTAAADFTAWVNADSEIRDRLIVLRNADSDAFQTRNHNRQYVLADVVSALKGALEAGGIQNVVADSDSYNGLGSMVVTHTTGATTLPTTPQIQHGIKFEFFADATIDTDAKAYTSATIQNYDDFLTDQTGLVNGSVYARYPGKLGNSLGYLIVDASVDDSEFSNTVVIGESTKLSDLFDDKPATSVWGANLKSDLKDEVHIVVYTTDSNITGQANEVLETYAYLSKAKNAKTADGGPNYYLDVVNAASKWVHIIDEETAANKAVSATDEGIAFGTTLRGTQTKSFKALTTNGATAGVRQYTLGGGNDGGSVTDANYISGYSLLADVEATDVSLLITGGRSKVVQKHVIENVAEKRLDCVAFISPDYASAVSAPSAAAVVDYFNNSTDGFNSSSYAVFDSGWKRQYDRYNDDYFWIPLNADIAGLSARTDSTNEAWFSPAGLNRGFIKNVIKLSFNPDQAARDSLYTKRINPVVTFRGQGTLLYGDKTALSRPSAFDRINVRRLFIVLEKAIATAAKYQLFEFNDDLTRRTFVNAIEPFLADIKSRRGMTDFKVVCDTSNNTPDVIDSNRFVADIYIKPNRSINFITLNFVAVRTGVSFSEVAGS